MTEVLSVLFRTFGAQIRVYTSDTSETTSTASYQTLSTLSTIFFIIAGVAFAALVFLFFYLHINRVISDLSGRTARKRINKIRQGNESIKKKTYAAYPVNRGEDQKKNAGEPLPENQDAVSTVSLSADSSADRTVPLEESGEANRTASLLADQPREKRQAYPDDMGSSATTPLSELSDIAASTTPLKEERKLEMIDDVMLVHTDEVI